MKALKLPFVVACIAELITAVFLLWFYTRTGTSGLFKWNFHYAGQFHLLESFLLFPPLLFGLTVLFHYVCKTHPALSVAFGTLCIIVSMGVAGFCIYKTVQTIVNGHRVPRNRAVVQNMLPRNNVPPLTHIAISSDPHWNADTSNATERTLIMQNINSRKYDALFILGDISDEGDIRNGYETVVTDINTYLPDTPVRLIMGNHDSLVDAKSIFQTYFNDSPKAPLYYRMDSDTTMLIGKKTHFLVLNLLWGTEDFTPAQRHWLIKQLEEIPQTDVVIVMSHCFSVSSGYVDKQYQTHWYDMPSMIQKLCPIFEKYHVDLVLSGHNHLMNVLTKNGVTYAICGAMGGPLDNELDYTSPYQNWIVNNSHGWLDVLLETQQINLTYYDFAGTELYRRQVPLN